MVRASIYCNITGIQRDEGAGIDTPTARTRTGEAKEQNI